MDITDVLHTDQGLTFIGAVLTGLWTLFKTTEWVAQARNRRYYRAVEALEAAVEETYRTYVQAIKAASADGKLSADERRHARELARERAIEFGRTVGVDVLRELGAHYIDLWISRLINRAKRGGE